MRPLTIGLPVYNGMPFLRETIPSLLLQTDGDFTILAIDDGSTDGSLEFLNSVQDRRLRVVSQENRGLTATLNRMLHEIDTPWLMRHDADDIALPTRVEITKRFIRLFPESGMFYTEARYLQRGRSVAAFRTTRADPATLRSLTLKGQLLAICHPTVTLNVNKVLAVGGYRFNFHVEDIDLWWRMAIHHEIRFIPEVTTYIRHNAASISANNLERQSVNMLYIQYLLLSHVYRRQPRPHDMVEPTLSAMLNRSQLQFRARMRLANIHFANQDYMSAGLYLARAALRSPAHFAQRVCDEMNRHSIVTNGENPQVFLKAGSSLWPNEASPTGEVSAGSKSGADISDSCASSGVKP